jgi:hypothetical protein
MRSRGSRWGHVKRMDSEIENSRFHRQVHRHARPAISGETTSAAVMGVWPLYSRLFSSELEGIESSGVGVVVVVAGARKTLAGSTQEQAS